MKLLITGCTGSLGTAVTQALLKVGHRVIGYSRCEFKQSQFIKHPNLILYLGDVRDRDRLLEASRGVDMIFHFAALKHVDQLEQNPEESVATNILGTQNVLYAQRNNNLRRVILVSTDKAAYPVNVYGASKLIAERLTLRNPSNVVCRYGNVLASRGSVLGKFVNSLLLTRSIEVTDFQMSRFWITVEDAARFVIASAMESEGGLKIPTMKAAPLFMIVEALTEILKIDHYTEIVIGRRPGEKTEECLRTEFEGGFLTSNHAIQYTKQELINLLTPIVEQLRCR